ncbi:multidrug effflux MFS transporter [Sphingobium sp. LB126]|uniref:multidrug effflux MFS transporter n=1 Tax=Sphingobium sp. LB126 TaxID=1983755 RepID=UPI0012FD1584|nr:multidrug effflux MFS transporter [Sphingobium sp. LB126]
MTALPTQRILLLASFAALTPMAVDMYLPAMPGLADDLGVGMSAASYSISAFFFGVAFGQLFAGPLSDRHGRKPVIAGGLILFIAASVAAALCDSFLLLMLARVTQAFGACAATVAGRAIVRDCLDLREAARTFSLLALVGSIAPILAPMLGTLVTKFGDWRSIFQVMGGFALVVLVCQLAFLPETRSAAAESQSRSESPLRSYLTLLGNRRILGYLLAASGNSACLFTYIANSATVLMKGYGLNPFAFSLAFGANAVGLLIANQSNRHMLKSRDVETVLRRSAVSAAIMGPLFLLFALTQIGGLPFLMLLLFAGVSSTAIVQANVMAGALSVDPLRAGSTSALYGATTFAFGTLAASLAATLEYGSGGGMAFIIALGFMLCSASILLLIIQRPKSKMTGETV